MMRKYLKYFSSLVFIPLVQWYLRKERSFSCDGINIIVWPGVFHPGLFHSTKFLLRYLKGFDLSGKSFLELGCGSGLLSVYAAKKGAIVTASDISNSAVDNTLLNAQRNNVSINAFHSDLFDAHPQQQYDWIAINPPFYAKDPKTEADHAWYCGEEFEYFESLFRQLPVYSTSSTSCMMVLTKGCDLEAITAIAKKNGFLLEMTAERNALFDEKDYLYRIRALN